MRVIHHIRYFLLRLCFALLLGGLAGLVLSPPAQAKTSRIKDIVNIEGVRDNQLIGYGIVVGSAIV